MAVTEPRPLICRPSPWGARRSYGRGSKMARENDTNASPARRKKGVSGSLAGTLSRSAARAFPIGPASRPLPPSWHSRSSV